MTRRRRAPSWRPPAIPGARASRRVTLATYGVGPADAPSPTSSNVSWASTSTSRSGPFDDHAALLDSDTPAHLDDGLERRLPARPRLPRAAAAQRQQRQRGPLVRPRLRRAHRRGCRHRRTPPSRRASTPRPRPSSATRSPLIPLGYGDTLGAESRRPRSVRASPASASCATRTWRGTADRRARARRPRRRLRLARTAARWCWSRPVALATTPTRRHRRRPGRATEPAGVGLDVAPGPRRPR